MARQTVLARLIRLADDDGSFDLEFWSRAGETARFDAAWQATCDLVAMGKLGAKELRPRRSVVRLRRGSFTK